MTNPIAKAVLYRAGFADPGHTEYLARLAREMMGVTATPVMMLWCPELAVDPGHDPCAAARSAARCSPKT